jgi:trehalose-6-phosphatase
LASSVNTWQNALQRAVAQAQAAQHICSKADPLQVAFEIHGLILALHYEARFLRNPGAADRARQGFAAILSRYQA